MKLTYYSMRDLFNFYNSRQTSNRTSFIKTVTKKFPSVTEEEACIAWQAFDFAYEMWAIDTHSGDE